MQNFLLSSHDTWVALMSLRQSQCNFQDGQVYYRFPFVLQTRFFIYFWCQGKTYGHALRYIAHNRCALDKTSQCRLFPQGGCGLDTSVHPALLQTVDQFNNLIQRQMKVGQAQTVETQKRFQRTPGFIVKGFVIFFITAAFLIYRFVFTLDFTQALFLFPVNRWMDRDPLLTIILVGQLFIDCFALLVAIVWLWKSKNIHTFHTAAMFYAMRFLYIKILYFPFPDDIVWRSPPIPSIVVPYDRTRDFFFSGHTGLAIIFTTEVTSFKLPKWIQYLAYLMIAWMPLMLISSRIHYTIDVLAAPLYTKLNYDIVKLMGKCPDYFWSLPYIAYRKIRDSCCSQAKQYEDNNLIDQIQR